MNILDRIKNKLSKIRLIRSLKLRIFLIILAVGIIPSAIMHFAILNNYEERAVSLRTSDVQNQCKILANHLITYNYLLDTSSAVVNSELEQLSNLYDGRILIIDDNFKIIKDTYALNEGKTIISEEVIKCFKGESINHYDDNNH